MSPKFVVEEPRMTCPEAVEVIPFPTTTVELWVTVFPLPTAVES
jgi:hypothetical protein